LAARKALRQLPDARPLLFCLDAVHSHAHSSLMSATTTACRWMLCPAGAESLPFGTQGRHGVSCQILAAPLFCLDAVHCHTHSSRMGATTTACRWMLFSAGRGELATIPEMECFAGELSWRSQVEILWTMFSLWMRWHVPSSLLSSEAMSDDQS